MEAAEGALHRTVARTPHPPLRAAVEGVAVETQCAGGAGVPRRRSEGEARQPQGTRREDREGVPKTVGDPRRQDNAVKINGATVQLPINPSNVEVNKLKLDKDRKALLERKNGQKASGKSKASAAAMQDVN